MKHRRRKADGDYSVLLFNLEHLSFSWLVKNKTLALKTRSGKILTTLDVEDGTSKEERVFQLLDKALGVEIYDDNGQRAFYAFINPHTDQIALNPVPKTVAFSGKDISDISPNGKWVSYENGVLKIENTILEALQPDYSLIKSVLNNQ